MQYLLSLPESLTGHFHSIEGKPANEWFVASDPEGRALGSGGGTAWLLNQCWQSQSPGDSFEEWLESEKRVLIHAGGKSRRLPAYAATGKILTPIPIYRWERGQKIDQKLLDIQLPFYKKILSKSPAKLNTLIASGDILILNEEDFGRLPEVDVILFGTWTEAVQASNHGVFFCHRNNPDELSFILQKPSTDRIQELVENYYFLMDVGVWLLSPRAVNKLMESCKWDTNAQQFMGADGQPEFYDLYGEFSKFLGIEPVEVPEGEERLTTAVVSLKAGSFYHFGTSRELTGSAFRIQNKITDQREIWHKRVKPHPDIFVMNVLHDGSIDERHSNLWIENSYIPSGWKFSNGHIFTGIPPNDWNLEIHPGICLDIIPVGDNRYCIRPYGIDDIFSGRAGDHGTTWLNRPLEKWFEDRGLRMGDIWGTGAVTDSDPDISLAQTETGPANDIRINNTNGTAKGTDIFDLPLFPVVGSTETAGELIKWMIDPANEAEGLKERWLKADRLQASQIQYSVNLGRLYRQRQELMIKVLPTLAKNHNKSVFYQLDLDHLSDIYSGYDIPVPAKAGKETPLINRIHNRMFLARVNQKRGQQWEPCEHEAFEFLREGMIRHSEFRNEKPVRKVLRDQIVWARSPVRLDLAGGWSDTPPYCIINGGRVMNMAVELNGQPPIQVYITPSDNPEIRIKSIDLGIESRISEYSELGDYSMVGSGFTIAKAALMLSGFHPHYGASYSSLKEQLKNFGSGIDISFLAAVPKGSGLGTSSILAATLLGALADYCGLDRDPVSLGKKTLVLEQMLTTGGGWQDQYGGIIPGTKVIETRSGFGQEPEISWLPDNLFRNQEYRSCMLLYYTGVTRVAKNILTEIVRGMFLNRYDTLATVRDIASNATWIGEALRKNSWEDFNYCIEESWRLNRQLDEGTNPEAVQNILKQVDHLLLSKKLLGAGGGGYLLMIAKSPDAAAMVKKHLSAGPPNDRARFVDFTISQSGLSITRS
jgi:galactokinase/mevalonate kinase-like predicted kinase